MVEYAKKNIKNIKNIQEYNQDLIKSELTAALAIRNQFCALTEVMYRHHKKAENMRALQQKAKEVINNMLKADSKEAFDAHKKRFDGLIYGLRKILQVGSASEEELLNYRIYYQVQRLLKGLTQTNASKETQELIDFWEKLANKSRMEKNNSVYEEWKQKLNQLCKIVQNTDKFEDYKMELQNDLVALMSEEGLENRASVALIERSARSLAAIRLSYLQEKFNRKELGVSMTWIVIGILVGAAGTVLGFAFPALIIPGFLIGAAAMIHGAVDFFKESISLGSKITSAPELGDREVSKETKKEIELFEWQLHEAPGKLLKDLFSKKAWSAAKEWQQVLGYVMVFLSLAIAVTGFVTLFPGLAISMPAVIALTAIGTAITVLALGLYGYQVFQTRKELSELKKGVEDKITADKQVLAEPIDQLYHRPELSSGGKMLRTFRESKEELKVQEIKAQEIDEPSASVKLFRAATAESGEDFKSLEFSN